MNLTLISSCHASQAVPPASFWTSSSHFAGLPEETAPGNFVRLSGQWQKSIRHKVKESTYWRYTHLLETYLVPAFGSRTMDTLTTAAVEIYLQELLSNGGRKKTGLSSKSVSDIKGVLSSICTYSRQAGYESPCNFSQLHIRREKENVRVLSRTEQEALTDLLKTKKDRRSMGVLLSLYTGIRLGEVCALQEKDLSLKERTLSICRTMQRIRDDGGKQKTKIVITSPKSDASIREIPLPDFLTEQLEPFVQEEGDCFFLTGQKEKFVEPRSMENHFKNLCRECEIEHAHFHSLRHTFATRSVELGFDIKSLSAILGHPSVSITLSLYVHPTMEMKRENMNKLSDLY